MSTQDILMSELSSTPIHIKAVKDKYPEITLDELQTVAWDLIDRGVVRLDGNWKLSIKEHSSQVAETFTAVVAHTTDKHGVIDSRKMEELEGRFGSNGSRGCDVRKGPCSCGAWH